VLLIADGVFVVSVLISALPDTALFRPGKRMAWLLFLTPPEYGAPGSAEFLQAEVDRLPSGNRRGAAKYGVARCQWLAGNHPEAFALLTQATEDFQGLAGLAWTYIAFTEGASWALELRMLAETEDVSGTAIDLAASLARLGSREARLLLVRASAMLALQRVDEARSAAEAARRILSRRRDRQLAIFADTFASKLDENPP
jgi:hypothetical protein